MSQLETDDDYSTSFTEGSEALDDCAQGVLAECGAARRGNAFLDLEMSCCCSCRVGQGLRRPMLTLVVLLQAIFLSTSVMIGQNRQSNFQQAKADHDFKEQELELKANTRLTREIRTLTTELHDRLLNSAR